MNVACALSLQASLSSRFWGECIKTTAYLINQTPPSILPGKTPVKILFSKPPNISHLRIFGCLYYAHMRTTSKFQSCSRRCIFLGYHQGKNGGIYMTLTPTNLFLPRCKIL